MRLTRFGISPILAILTVAILPAAGVAQPPVQNQPSRPAPRQATRTQTGPPLDTQPRGGQPAARGTVGGQPAQRQPQPGQRQPGQVGPAQPRQGAQPANAESQVIRAPFQLTPEQQTYLNQVLDSWEAHTSKIKHFECKFKRWSYDPAFASAFPQYKDKPIELNEGVIRYVAPDRGTLRVDKVEYFNAKEGKYEEAEKERGEHWVSDGEFIYERKYEVKTVFAYPIPDDVRGKAIRNTPLPFLFGSKADDLKQRYFLRVVTPKEFAEREIWLDAFPRSRIDAANFQRAIMRFDRSTFQPVAMRIDDPGGASKSYSFSKISINPKNPLKKIQEFFAAPTVPHGWKRVVQTPAESTASRPSEPR